MQTTCVLVFAELVKLYLVLHQNCPAVIFWVIVTEHVYERHLYYRWYLAASFNLNEQNKESKQFEKC